MKTAWQRLLILCRGDAAKIAPWLEERDTRWLWICVVTIALGYGLFGGVVGLWRAPMQGAFTAIKLPLVVFLTCGANALLNGLLAQVLGSGLGFRQSSLVILMSFTMSAVILAALSPVAYFILENAPPLSSASRGVGHSVTLLTDVLFIAYAGIVANRRLFRLLEHACPGPGVASRIFWSWLAGNLFLGAQLSWVLRPFIGTPQLAVQFLRDDPLRGNFYEAVYHAIRQLLRHHL
jgi:hypothetical protein